MPTQGHPKGCPFSFVRTRKCAFFVCMETPGGHSNPPRNKNGERHGGRSLRDGFECRGRRPRRSVCRNAAGFPMPVASAGGSMPRPYGSICFFAWVEKCGRFLNRPYGMWGIWCDSPGCGGRFGGYCGTVITVPYEESG